MALIAMVALLGIGMATMLAVRSDTVSSGADRFQQAALYAAESGVAAGIDFLRNNCPTDGTFFTSILNTAPTGITGNNVQPGQTGNPFSSNNKSYYSVSIKNNSEAVATVDSDAVVVIRSIGYAANQTSAILEVTVKSPDCISSFCTTGYAQGFNNSSNDNTALCASTITASSLRSATP